MFSCYFLMLSVMVKVRPIDRGRQEKVRCMQHNVLVVLSSCSHSLFPKNCFVKELFLLKCCLPSFSTDSHLLLTFCFADNLTDRCEKMVCLCDQEAAKCWGAAPYNPHFILWPDFLCGQTHPTCHFSYGGPE